MTQGQLDPIQLMRKIDELENKINAMRTIEVGGVWQDWTPTLSASGSMSVTSVVITRARYAIIGKVVKFMVRADFTTGGTASNSLYFTLPVSSITNNNSHGCMVGDQGAFAGFTFHLNTSTIGVRRYDSANWSLGASRYIQVSGSYEIA